MLSLDGRAEVKYRKKARACKIEEMWVMRLVSHANYCLTAHSIGGRLFLKQATEMLC